MPNLKTAFIEDLQAAQTALRDRVNGIPESDWERASANEGWTNRDLLAHLASIDERLRSQVDCVYGRQPWPSDTIDEYNERALAQRGGASVEQLRRELEAESAATISFAEGLSEADLAHRFDHPRRGDVSLEEWLRIIPNHIQSHLGDFRAS